MNVARLNRRVAQWIEKEQLFSKDEQVLLAISGGKDSVALAHILHKLEYSFGLAHMNFQLRGKDSDGDEDFVRALAERLGVAFHVKRVDTKKVALAGESTQMAARRLRYNWFKQLMTEEEYSCVATAHTANDNAETILFNLSQGTGLKGLLGIPVKNQLVKRPLLCLSTEEVLGYLKAKDIKHREDRSNSSDAYKRNYIRHHVVPALREVNNQVIGNLFSHSSRFREISGYYHERLEADRRKYWAPTSYGNWQLSLPSFIEERFAQNMLIEWLRPFSFSTADLTSIIDSQTGAYISNTSKSYLLVKERAHLTLVKAVSETLEDRSFSVAEPGFISNEHGSLSWEMIYSVEHENLRAQNHAYLDMEQLTDTKLTLACAKDGDRMRPFGMKGSQLISDFAVNAKLGYEEKKQLLTLWDGDRIAWIVGQRSSDLHKVTSHSKRILKLTWSKKTKSPFPFTESI